MTFVRVDIPKIITSHFDQFDAVLNGGQFEEASLEQVKQNGSALNTVFTRF